MIIVHGSCGGILLHRIMDRLGWPTVAILLTTLVTSVGLLTYTAVRPGSDAHSRSSPAYMEGWKEGSRKEMQFDSSRSSFGSLVSYCSGLAEGREHSTYPNGYAQRQRYEWSRGCLDYLRNEKNVPEQSWEN
ncbi:hypothetical protein ACFU96_45625 [Streptomyces sp. NPDC057620]|uniref:hypothetical protein n=1 Tax=Streptomyces sp. NPDC057620 TaxID=3346185 RepID=UPI0036ADBCFB